MPQFEFQFYVVFFAVITALICYDAFDFLLAALWRLWRSAPKKSLPGLAFYLALGVATFELGRVSYAQSSVVMGESPIDLGGTLFSIWAFVSGPIGLVFGFAFGIFVCIKIFRLVQSPIRSSGGSGDYR